MNCQFVKVQLKGVMQSHEFSICKNPVEGCNAISFQELCSLVISTLLVRDLNCFQYDKVPLVAQSASLAYNPAFVGGL